MVELAREALPAVHEGMVFLAKQRRAAGKGGALSGDDLVARERHEQRHEQERERLSGRIAAWDEDGFRVAFGKRAAAGDGHDRAFASLGLFERGERLFGVSGVGDEYDEGALVGERGEIVIGVRVNGLGHLVRAEIDQDAARDAASAHAADDDVLDAAPRREAYFIRERDRVLQLVGETVEQAAEIRRVESFGGCFVVHADRMRYVSGEYNAFGFIGQAPWNRW